MAEVVRQTPAPRPKPSMPVPAFKPWYLTLRAWIIIVLFIVLELVAWRTTKIDLKTLASPSDNARKLALSFLQPELFSRDQKSELGRIPLQVPCTANPPSVSSNGDGQLSLSAPCADPGAIMTLKGSGYHPNASISLEIADPLGNPSTLRPANTDAQGNFETQFVVPDQVASPTGDLSIVRVRTSYETGDVKPSQALIQTVNLMGETILLALLATTVAIIFTVPISFLGAHNLMAGSPIGEAIYWITRTILNILRAVEPLIWAVIFIVWVGVGPFAGVLALILHSIASLGKLYSEAIEAIDPGPLEAITATGANRFQVIMYGVVPQIVPPFLAFTMYRWDINVRMSTILGLVGGGGIGFVLLQWINLLQYRQAAVAVWAIVVVVAVLDYLSAVVRERVQ